MSIPAFRFAPSPNGRLHLGHAYSALLNERAARTSGGRFLIRVEDIDTIRCTRALARAALDDLAWLGLQSDAPVLYQSDHFADYQAAQDRLRSANLLYPCFCSRHDVEARADPEKRDPEGQPIYPGTCKGLALEERIERLCAGLSCAWRIDMPRAVDSLSRPLRYVETMSGIPLEQDALVQPWGDVVIVRKDIGTSYHLAVVVDDARQGISHVIRGSDLLKATAIHRLLQELLGLPQPIYRHHDLIGDETGRKLSKSIGDRSLAMLREQGVTAQQIRKELGF
jgi:glutamyl-Q tRNA(Asp) synthetase